MTHSQTLTLTGASQIELHMGAGRELATHAGRVWRMMTGRERRLCLWDLPLDAKQDWFERAIASACFSGVAYDDGAALAGWTVLAGGGEGATQAIHFVSAGHSPWQQDVAGVFVRRALEQCEMLICIIPVHWRGARAFAQALGMREALRLPKLCWIAEAQRNLDGVLYFARRGHVQAR